MESIRIADLAAKATALIQTAITAMTDALEKFKQLRSDLPSEERAHLEQEVRDQFGERESPRSIDSD